MSSGSHSGSAVHGFKGSGMENDPLLVETAAHLERLFDVEVASKGYYFKQTADIEVAADVWDGIALNGHYDGGGHAVRKTSGGPKYLFKSVPEGSSVKRLGLVNMGLADVASGNLSDCKVAFDVNKAEKNYRVPLPVFTGEVIKGAVGFLGKNGIMERCVVSGR